MSPALIRRCYVCGQTLPVDRFSFDGPCNTRKYGRKNICRTCNTRKRDAWLAGLSDAAYDRQRAQRRRRDQRLSRARVRRHRRDEAIATVRLMLAWLHEWGYTACAIADAAGCQVATVRRWETKAPRHHITRATVDRIAAVYLAEIDWRMP